MAFPSSRSSELVYEKRDRGLDNSRAGWALIHVIFPNDYHIASERILHHIIYILRHKHDNER